MSNAVSLATDRLVLRSWRDTDREPFAKMNANPVVMECYPSTMTRDQSDAMVDRMQAGLEERGWGLWAVELTGDVDSSVGSTSPMQRPFIGYVGLAEPRFQAHFTPCVEIGWRLDSNHWGRGYATEAAAAVCRFVFEELKREELVSFTATINQRSIRVMKKIGMTHDPAEDFDHPNLPQGHVMCRHVLYRLKRPGMLVESV